MKFPKKTAISALTLSFLLGNSAALNIENLVPRASVTFAQDNNEKVLSNLEKSEENKFNDDDKVTIIVKLKEGAVAPEVIANADSRKEREKDTKPVREEALKKIKDQGIDYNKLFDYDLLFNGFSLETTYKDAKKIQSLDFVDSVELNVTYDKPTTTTNSQSTPTLDSNYGKASDSNNIIDIQPLWDKGIKGQGRVVAVIDSGLDTNHEVLRITDPSTAKYKNKEEFEAAKKKAGINYGRWYSDKLIYAFNYNDQNDDIKEEDNFSHGMHVAGTAVGNPSVKASNGDYVAGVAPEAQLIFMRVFSDKQNAGSTSSYIYMKAVEDAVKLGADSINMSLGGATGSVLDIGKGISDAIELAKQAGVTVAIAAGNSNTFGYGYRTPLAKNPDYGLVSTPSVDYDSISVAAINNTALNYPAVDVKELYNNSSFNNGKLPILQFQKTFDSSKDYSYVHVGLGKVEDFNGKDLSGKIALIERGSLSFVDKVTNAKNAGAIGAVIYNYKDGGDAVVPMALNGLDKDYPIVSIGYNNGLELAAHADSYKLSFLGSYVKQPNPTAGRLADFSSWGLSSDGELKPDLTAPGGDIYSSFNNNTYGLDSGTSMASPHVAGAIALIKQVLLERFPDLNNHPEDIQKLIKHLAMSTANPNINRETHAFTSPRQQGAGVLDTNKAAYGDLYLTGDNDYSSISLGNVGDEFSFNVIVHNISNEDKKLTYTTYLTTDDVQNGSMTLRPRDLGYTDGAEEITVPAHSEKKVTIKVDATKFKNDLLGLMPNGYYLEGFTEFYDANSDSDEGLVSIPFVGFRGEFQNLPVIEKPIYDFTGDEKPFYYIDPMTGVRDEKNNFTSLVTTIKEGNEDVLSVLGEYTDLSSGKEYFGKIAFSPNGDEINDEVGFKGMFLRNYENLNVAVYAKDDVNHEHPLFTAGNESGRKNFYDNNPERDKATLIDASIWKGEDNNGNALPDGEYQYVVTYYPVATGASAQSMTFNVTLDRVAPKIEGTGGVYDEATRTFKPYLVTENGSGLVYTTLSYNKEVEDKDGKKKNEETFVEMNKDGSYTLPEGVDLEKFTYKVEDYAGNTDSVQLSKVQSSEKGTISVNLTSTDGKTSYTSDGRYRITNEKGEIVGEDFIKNNKTLRALPYGKYKVELVLLDEELKLLTPKTVEVEISKEHPSGEVNFQFEEVSSNTLIINFDKVLPIGTTVYATDETGEKTLIPRSKYSTTQFQKSLLNGSYTIEVNLPEGYSSSENNFKFEVENERNVKNLTLNVAQKVSSLTTEFDNNPITVEFNNEVVYNDVKLVVANSSDEAIKDINTKLTDMQEELARYNASYLDIHFEKDGKEMKVDGSRQVSLKINASAAKVYHQKDSTGDIEAINDAKLKDGVLSFTADEFSNFVILTPKAAEVVEKAVDKTTLETLVKEYDSVVATDAFKFDTKEDQENYVQAARNAEKVLKNEDATQEDVEAAIKNLESAKNALDGKEVANKDALKAAIAKASDIKNSDKYTYSSNELKENYNKAINNGMDVEADENASKESIEAAVNNINTAEAALNGVKKDVTPNNQNNNSNANNGNNNSSKDDNEANLTPNLNTKELQSELEKSKAIKNSKDYSSKEEKLRIDYDNSLREASVLLSKKDVTQEEVDSIVKKLADLRSKLEPKKSILASLIDEDENNSKDKKKSGLASFANDTTNLSSTPSKGGKLSNTGTTTTSTVALGGILLGAAYFLRRKVKTNK